MMKIYQHPAHFGKLLFLDEGVFSEFGKATATDFEDYCDNGHEMTLKTNFSKWLKRKANDICLENDSFSTVLFYLIL